MKQLKTLLLILIPILFFGNGVQAQHDAIYSQYMFNPFAINPAYAGSRNALSAVLLHRNQWVGMAGAPKTTSIAVHSPFKGKNFALGMNMYRETVGPNTNAGFSGTYAYHLKLGTRKLSFGLRGGFYNTSMDRSILNYDDASDQHNTGGYVTAGAPDFDFGTYYYTQHFYAGLSVNHINGAALKFPTTGQDNVEYNLDRHFMLATGMVFSKSPNLVFKPSVMVKSVEGAPLNVDLNMSFLLQKVLWLGASYRSSKSLVLITEYNITDFLRIGYSYDVILGQLKSYTGGSHEIFMGIDLSRGNGKSISPRYM